MEDRGATEDDRLARLNAELEEVTSRNDEVEARLVSFQCHESGINLRNTAIKMAFVSDSTYFLDFEIAPSQL